MCSNGLLFVLHSQENVLPNCILSLLALVNIFVSQSCLSKLTRRDSAKATERDEPKARKQEKYRWLDHNELKAKATGEACSTSCSWMVFELCEGFSCKVVWGSLRKTNTRSMSWLVQSVHTCSSVPESVLLLDPKGNSSDKSESYSSTTTLCHYITTSPFLFSAFSHSVSIISLSGKISRIGY